MSETNQDEKATGALIASLNERADATSGREVADDEPQEDIDAYLAGLEDEAEASEPVAVATAEPDPFADAFSELDAAHGDEVEAELAARARPPVARPEPDPTLEASAMTAEPVGPPAEEVVEASAKKKKSKPEVPVTESLQAPGLRFFFGLLKWTVLLAPVVLFLWVSGAFMGGLIETGWAIALLATCAAVVLPLVLRLVTRRGRWAYWASAIGLLGLVVLIAPWPGTAGEKLAHYGHWPASTVGQLAGWPADNPGTAISAFGSEFLGAKLGEAAGAPAPQDEHALQARALGSDQTIEAFMQAQRPEADQSPAQGGQGVSTPASPLEGEAPVEPPAVPAAPPADK